MVGTLSRIVEKEGKGEKKNQVTRGVGKRNRGQVSESLGCSREQYFMKEMPLIKANVALLKK